MNTVTDFKKLGGLPEDQRIKALAEAVNMELGLVNDFLSIQGGKSAAGRAVVVPGTARKDLMPSHAAVKAHLGAKYATPGDNPVLGDVATRVESFFHTNMPEVDLGWTNLFTYFDLRSSNQDSFEIIDTSAGVTFKQRAPGEKVEIRRNINEDSLSVKYVTYADGVGILDDWLRFQKFWQVEQVVAEFRAQAWDKMAEIHYGLFTALGSGINVAFDTDDTRTFNKAAASLLRGVRASGYAAGQNAGLWIVTSPEQVGRVTKMLEATRGSLIVGYNANSQPIAYNVAGVIATTYVDAADAGYYLVLPNRKIQRANWMDLSIESNRDIYKRAQDWVGTMQFNAAIGDTAQVRRVLFA